MTTDGSRNAASVEVSPVPSDVRSDGTGALRATLKQCEGCSAEIPAFRSSGLKSLAKFCTPCRHKSRVANGEKSCAEKHTRHRIDAITPKGPADGMRAARVLAGIAVELDAAEELPTVLAAIGMVA